MGLCLQQQVRGDSFLCQGAGFCPLMAINASCSLLLGGLSEAGHLKLLALDSLLSRFNGCLPPCKSKRELLYLADCSFLLKGKLTEDQDVGTQILVSRWQSSSVKFDDSPVLGELLKPQLNIKFNQRKSMERAYMRFRY